MKDWIRYRLEDETGREPHYHVWTLYQVRLPWPNSNEPDGWEDTQQMVYVSSPKPYASRSTANNNTPHWDARREYGSKRGMVLACDGGEGCPYYVDRETGRDIRASK